jgi:hypothetical protein
MTPAELTEIFLALRATAARSCPSAAFVGLRLEPGIRDRPRHFGVYYPGEDVIAVDPDLLHQGITVVRGILSHELGHAIAQHQHPHTVATQGYDEVERLADREAHRAGLPRVVYGPDTVQRAGPGARGTHPRPKGLRNGSPPSSVSYGRYVDALGGTREFEYLRGKAALDAFRARVEEIILDVYARPTRKPYGSTTKEIVADITENYEANKYLYGISRAQVGQIVASVLNNLARRGLIEKDTNARVPLWWAPPPMVDSEP